MELPSHADQAERLTLNLAQHSRGSVLTVVGELDHDTSPRLLNHLTQVLHQHPDAVVIDCAGITFCDSSGLNTLLRTRHRAHEQQRPLTLAAPSRAMLRLLQITGADAALDTTPTVAEALTTP